MGRLKSAPNRLAFAPARLTYANRQEAERARDAARAARAEATARRLYNTKRWRDPETGLRVQILTRDGWRCRNCSVDLIGARHAPDSPVVDHIQPHKGNLALFWDPENLQALCKRCHDGWKQAQDHRQGGG